MKIYKKIIKIISKALKKKVVRQTINVFKKEPRIYESLVQNKRRSNHIMLGGLFDNLLVRKDTLDFNAEARS